MKHVTFCAVMLLAAGSLVCSETRSSSGDADLHVEETQDGLETHSVDISSDLDAHTDNDVSLDSEADGSGDGEGRDQTDGDGDDNDTTDGDRRDSIDGGDTATWEVDTTDASNPDEGDAAETTWCEERVWDGNYTIDDEASLAAL